MEDMPYAETDDNTEEVLSRLFHALRTARRRDVIRLLSRQGGNSEVRTRWLARQIAGREDGIDPAQVRGEKYKNVYNALSQSHLPSLSEANVIVYDPQRQKVLSGPMLRLAALLLAINRPAVETFYDRPFDDERQSFHNR
jgi:hypothetical protein